MYEEIKDNKYILSHKEEFLAVYEKAKEHFSTYEGVIGVAFGQKNTAGAYGNDLSIVIIVNEKKDEADIPVEQRIPEYFQGYLTDVEIPKGLQYGACDNTAEYEEIKGGIQVSTPVNAAGQYEIGTLGCIVRRKHDTDRENVHLLSNAHVLFGAHNQAGNYIYHPFAPTPSGLPSLGPSNALGPVAARAFLGNFDYTPPGASGPREFFIDCATARINIDCKCLGTTCTKDVIKTDPSIVDLNLGGSNAIADVRNLINDLGFVGSAVYKVGRTTGKTKGIVRYVNWMEPFQSGHLKELIVIDFDTASTASGKNCKGHAWFGEKGDSGSLVVDEQRRAIGLLFGVPPPGSPVAHPSFACHILPVLENLGFCIPTEAGTGRCSCSATDGTGLVASNTIDTDGIFFTKNSAGASDKDSGLFQPEPITEDQQNHLSGLLHMLRTTDKGIELHETFRHIRREVGYLVRKVRPVKVVWHRNKGPAFFNGFLNHLRGELPEYPKEINEVPLRTLLDKMAVQLMEHGSIPLNQAISEHGQLIRTIINENSSVHDIMDYLNTLQEL